MTTNVNQYWSVTPRPAERVGPVKWLSKIWLVRRDTSELVKTFEGSGATQNSAMANGQRLAAREAETMGVPEGWKTRQAPPDTVIL